MLSARETIAIRLRRLPKVDQAPALIQLLVDTSRGAKPPARIGSLTDAALRGRLAHYDMHSANEVAAIRRALSADTGETTVYESWPAVETCLQFWYGFVGSQIRAITWTCEKCGASDRKNVGGTVGESFAWRCPCGQIQRATVPK
jgi:hypothetical protein